MDILVFLEDETIDAMAYTTTDVIAEFAEVKHHAVRQMVRRYESDLNEFGVVAQVVPKPSKGSQGGRPQVNYKLNEEQAVLLITYLANTAPVKRFKKELVRQFFAQREELAKRKAFREVERTTRRSLTDAIQAWPYASKWSYKQLTDLLSKAATGMNVKQLRDTRGAGSKAAAAELMTSTEQAESYRLEQRAIALLDMGLSYKAIKAAVLDGDQMALEV